MQTFQLNGQTVRFFQQGETTYLVTSDANKAFGFSGDQTAIDKASESLSSVKVSLVINETFMDDLGNLPDRMLVIELPNLLGVITRSSKPELKNMQGIFNQLLAKSFAQNFGMQQNRPMLPAVTDDVRLKRMAGAVSNRDFSDKEPQDKINYPRWATVTEMLIELGEDPSDENSILVNLTFRSWLSRHMSDLYRSRTGEEPPIVKRKKSSGFCYPPSFLEQVELYRSTWLELKESA
jgi:hypothetical protein